MSNKTFNPNTAPHEAITKLRECITEQARIMGTDFKPGPVLSTAMHAAATVLDLKDHREYTEAEHFVADAMLQSGFETLNDNGDFYVCRLQDVLRLLDSFGLTADALFPKARTGHQEVAPTTKPLTRDGYAALLPDGQFAIVSEHDTHTGSKMTVTGGPLNAATVMPKCYWNRVSKHLRHLMPLIAVHQQTTVTVQIHGKAQFENQEPSDE